MQVFPGLEAHLIKIPPDNGRARKLHSHVSRFKKWPPAQTFKERWLRACRHAR